MRLRLLVTVLVTTASLVATPGCGDGGDGDSDSDTDTDGDGDGDGDAEEGATDDPILLYESNGVSLVDSCSHPFDPGNGTSMERVDLAGGDTEGNWAGSVCVSRSSPGRGHCF
jgi:hypothetical protein